MDINRDYIKHGNARPGYKLRGPLFGVAHDIGNGGSTARQNRNYFNDHQPLASAHTFIDDKEILEIIPINEKAWHVRYNVTTDNDMFGDDANDASIGVELCHGPNIDFDKAYKNYVEYWAYLCDKFGWNPHKQIVDHAKLDPARRTDPHNALNPHGITFKQFLNDVQYQLEGKIDRKPEAGGKTTDDSRFLIKVKAEHLHTYTKADWDAKKGAPIVSKDEIFTVKRTLDVNGYKMYELISGWFITANSQYVEIYKQLDKPKQEQKQKFVRVKVGQLWTYHTADWDDKAEIVTKDEVFTVVKDKFKVGGGHMYRIKSGLYITANSQYVEEYEK